MGRLNPQARAPLTLGGVQPAVAVGFFGRPATASEGSDVVCHQTLEGAQGQVDSWIRIQAHAAS